GRHGSLGDGDPRRRRRRRADRDRGRRRSCAFLLPLFSRRRRGLQPVVEAAFAQFRLEPLLRARDGEAFVVEELADARDDLDVALGVRPRADFFLPLRENGKLRLPVAKNVRSDLRHLAGFRGLVELLGHGAEYYFTSSYGSGAPSPCPLPRR